MNIEITENQKIRVKNEWEKIAKEDLEISADYITSPIYAFGTELAVLRLRNKFDHGRAFYSENLKSWVYINRN